MTKSLQQTIDELRDELRSANNRIANLEYERNNLIRDIDGLRANVVDMNFSNMELQYLVACYQVEEPTIRFDQLVEEMRYMRQDMATLQTQYNILMAENYDLWVAKGQVEVLKEYISRNRHLLRAKNPFALNDEYEEIVKMLEL